MDEKSAGFFAVFLNQGGLGVLALLCVMVLGYNTYNLNNLIKQGTTDQVTAARPLLLTQMGISLIGLLLAGGASFYLAVVDQAAKRVQPVELVLTPWESELDAKYRPQIRIDKQGVVGDQLVGVPCKPGAATNLIVDLDPYIRYRIDAGARNRVLLDAPVAP